jgi:hypothetical protein
MQVQHLAGGDIWLGPHRNSMVQLLEWEEHVTTLLQQGDYQNYTKDDWSLGLQFWSRLCIMEETALDFDLVIQVLCFNCSTQDM